MEKTETTNPKLPRNLYENVNNNFGFSVNYWNNLSTLERMQKIEERKAEYSKQYVSEMKELAALTGAA